MKTSEKFRRRARTVLRLVEASAGIGIIFLATTVAAGLYGFWGFLAAVVMFMVIPAVWIVSSEKEKKRDQSPVPSHGCD